jgi:hypothetical protein
MAVLRLLGTRVSGQVKSKARHRQFFHGDSDIPSGLLSFCRISGPTSITSELLELLNAYGLQQVVAPPTRRTSNGASLLDLVLCHFTSRLVSQVAAQPWWQISDHDLAIWLLSTISKPKPQFVNYEFRSLKNIDWSQFHNDLLQSELFCNPATSADDFVL